jgi:hypothetical protein
MQHLRQDVCSGGSSKKMITFISHFATTKRFIHSIAYYMRGSIKVVEMSSSTGADTHDVPQ